MGTPARKCSSPGCGRAHFCDDFCRRCFRNPESRPKGRRVCTFIGCDEPFHGLGGCKKHYGREIRRQARLYREQLKASLRRTREAVAAESVGGH